MADGNDKNSPFIYTEAKAGDVIRSTDWNAANQELMRLESAKVNRQEADTIQGPLTIEAALTVNGNVGIGTPTPNFALQVGDQNTVGSPKLSVTGRGSTGHWRQWTLRTGDGSDQQNIHKLRIRDEQAKADRLVIDENGYVGIGTTDPADTLDVHGALRFNGNAQQKIYGDSRAGSPAVVLAGRWNELEVKGRVIDWTGGNLHIGYENDHSNDSLHIGNGKLKSVKIESSTDLLIDAGKVGLGTPTPTEKLDIKGGKLQLEGNQQILFRDSDTTNNLKLQLWSGYGLGINGSTLFYAANGIHSWRDNNGINERMKLTTAANGGLTVLGTGKSSFAGNLDVLGKLSIGTTESTAQLTIAGSGNVLSAGVAPGSTANIDMAGHVQLKEYGTGNLAYLQARDDSSNRDIGLRIRTQKQGSSSRELIEAMTISPDGNIGIGTQTPNKAKLQISGGSKIPNLKYSYLNLGGPTGKDANTGSGNTKFSLYADERIACPEFNAFSDARIKQIKSRSNSHLDLQTLQNIEVTDYTMIDTTSSSKGVQKKVIGQQIAQIFPQAISLVTEIVPDILEVASVVNGRVILPDHGLRNGERVRMFLNDGQPVVLAVEEVNSCEFKIPLDIDEDVFIYGREVDDFHIVDYDSLSMLNISATQELCKIINGLKIEVQGLKVQLESHSPLEPLASVI